MSKKNKYNFTFFIYQKYRISAYFIATIKQFLLFVSNCQTCFHCSRVWVIFDFSKRFIEVPWLATMIKLWRWDDISSFCHCIKFHQILVSPETPQKLLFHKFRWNVGILNNILSDINILVLNTNIRFSLNCTKYCKNTKKSYHIFSVEMISPYFIHK